MNVYFGEFVRIVKNLYICVMIPHELLDKRQDDCRLLLSPGQRFLLLLCVLLLSWVVGNVLNGIIISWFGMSTRVLRIASVLQSMIQIILPSIVTVMMISRRPARFLEVDRSPGLLPVLTGILLLVAAVPALNYIIHWNASLQLPDALQGVEEWMRKAEESADNTIAIMQGGKSVGDLILNIMIIGIMAGLGEELLFRGTLQRMLSTSGMNPHLSIWLVAVLFSAIHMQFFGFVPRMLLGALFGYLLYWSGSLWLPVIVHASNNIMYVTARWFAQQSDRTENAVDTIGTVPDEYLYAVASVFVTAALLCFLRKVCKKSS